jgi:hypothetical protein
VPRDDRVDAATILRGQESFGPAQRGCARTELPTTSRLAVMFFSFSSGLDVDR